MAFNATEARAAAAASVDQAHPGGPPAGGPTRDELIEQGFNARQAQYIASMDAAAAAQTSGAPNPDPAFNGRADVDQTTQLDVRQAAIQRNKDRLAAGEAEIPHENGNTAIFRPTTPEERGNVNAFIETINAALPPDRQLDTGPRGNVITDPNGNIAIMGITSADANRLFAEGLETRRDRGDDLTALGNFANYRQDAPQQQQQQQRAPSSGPALTADEKAAVDKELLARQVKRDEIRGDINDGLEAIVGSKRQVPKVWRTVADDKKKLSEKMGAVSAAMEPAVDGLAALLAKRLEIKNELEKSSVEGLANVGSTVSAEGLGTGRGLKAGLAAIEEDVALIAKVPELEKQIAKTEAKMQQTIKEALKENGIKGKDAKAVMENILGAVKEMGDVTAGINGGKVNHDLNNLISRAAAQQKEGAGRGR